MASTFLIYQIPLTEKTRGICFEPFKQLYAQGKKPQFENYKFIYEGELTENMDLETIYEQFNVGEIPPGYCGRSLSVSDVVILNKDGKKTAYYVDPIGYKKLDHFLPETRQDRNKPPER